MNIHSAFHMLFILVLTIALPLLTAATPTPVTPPLDHALEKRWPCQTATPAFARVEESHPVESYLPNFIIGQDAHHTNRRDAFVEFAIPANAYGCQLEAYFPANYPIASSGAAQVYVYSTDKALSYSGLNKIDASWDYCPRPVAHVGTIVFGSANWGATRSVLNSFQCKAKMTYRLKMSTDSESGGQVQFVQKEGAGLRMVYNC
jgi:hypothetical protein